MLETVPPTIPIPIIENSIIKNAFKPFVLVLYVELVFSNSCVIFISELSIYSPVLFSTSPFQSSIEIKYFLSSLKYSLKTTFSLISTSTEP